MGLCVVLLAGGCVTTPSNETKPLTDDQLRAVFGRAKDARSFWITVYTSPNKTAQFSGANRVHPEQIAERKFVKETESTAPMIDVDNGREEKCVALIDTTTTRNWIDFPTFTRTKAIPLGPPAYDYTPRHVNDDVAGYACILTKLRFDQLHMENALLHFRSATGPLGPLARNENRPAPDIVIGCDLIKSFGFVQIDYPRHAVIIASTSEYAPDANTLIATVPLREMEGSFAADGAIDGEKQLFLLDSAGEFEIAMDNPSSDKLKQVSVGDIVFRNVSVVDSKGQGLGLLKYPRIGRQLLSKFKVTFVPKKKLVHFERPAGTE